MNQQWLIDHVLDAGSTIPKAPSDGREYLTLGEAERILEDTLEYLGAHGDALEYKYMYGHRKRLLHALSMIPKADAPGRSLLDVGCYGYMGFWARAHLGYERVVGIEWHPDNPASIITREARIGDEEIRFESHNIDISNNSGNPGFGIEERFDTVLFFEVLEHINTDPMGVMSRINEVMSDDGTLVMSVPNAISYKALREFLVGMPPWTYWFYEPDLSHEPRHCFEYTPIVFKSLLYASGMQPNAFRTVYAYSTPENEQDTLQIAQLMGCESSELGETMIAHCTKVREGVPLRYPDVLYSPEGYYSNIYPRLEPILRERLEKHKARVDELTATAVQAYIEHKPAVEPEESAPSSSTEPDPDSELAMAEMHTELYEAQLSQNAHLSEQCLNLRSQVDQLLFQSDCRLQRERELLDELEASTAARASSEKEALDTRVWAEKLSEENAGLRAQVNELLFACDCYLQQIEDPGHCARVIRERRFRWALDRSKSIARKTPVVRTALRPVYRTAKRFIKRRM